MLKKLSVGSPSKSRKAEYLAAYTLQTFRVSVRNLSFVNMPVVWGPWNLISEFNQQDFYHSIHNNAGVQVFLQGASQKGN